MKALLRLLGLAGPNQPPVPVGIAEGEGPTSQIERALAARRPWLRGWAAPPSLVPQGRGLTDPLQTWVSPVQARALMGSNASSPSLPPQKQPVDTSVFRNFPRQSPWQD